MHGFVMALLLTASIANPRATPVPFAIAQATDDSVCIITERELAPGQLVTIVLFDPERVIEGRVMAPAPKPCLGHPDDWGIVYSVTPSGNPTIEMGVGIAVIRESVTTRHQNGHVEMQNVFALGDRIRFRRCASMEGLHLTVWQGTARVWHEYYYLGYATDPTCTDEETEDDPSPN